MRRRGRGMGIMRRIIVSQCGGVGGNRRRGKVKGNRRWGGGTNILALMILQAPLFLGFPRLVCFFFISRIIGYGYGYGYAFENVGHSFTLQCQFSCFSSFISLISIAFSFSFFLFPSINYLFYQRPYFLG